MTNDDQREKVLQKFDRINVWMRGDERAPHKPLLILYALGRWQRGERGEVSFADVAQDVGELLREFGPPRKSYHPEYPFWRLQADGLWTVEADAHVEPRKGQTDAKKSELLRHNSRGAFVGSVQTALNTDPSLVGDIAERLLNAHFPGTIHGDILLMPWGCRWSQRRHRGRDATQDSESGCSPHMSTAVPSAATTSG